MAQKPINKILPADLPVDWNDDKYISSDGQDVGLTIKHGYNYLNGQINEAQEGVNAINVAFDDLATTDYVDDRINIITGVDLSVIEHANNSEVHTNAAEKAKWNTTPKVFHWSLGDNVDVGTSYLSGILDSTTSTSWTNVGTSNQPPSFSAPFEANIVIIISLDCEAFGTASGNDNNGNCMRFTFNRGLGTSLVKYRSLKVAGVDWFSTAGYDQQVRGTIALVESFENQPANVPINISLAHRRIASDWGASSHIGGRSVTYIAYPI